MATQLAFNQIKGYQELTPETFGAVGDDATAGAANKTAFDAMIAYQRVNGGRVVLGPKVYTILGSIDPTTNGQAHAITWIGAGSFSSELHFSDYVSGQTKGIDFVYNAVNIHMEGFTVRGAGKTTLNDASAVVSGLAETNTSATNGAYMKDLAFREWSGDGAKVDTWFQQRWVGCYARDCGQWGIISDGDQAPYFTGSSGAFFRDNGTGGLWIKRGSAFVQDLNLENLDLGLKIGVDTAARCKLTILGGNLERLNSGSTGIYVAAFSSIIQAQGVAIQGPETASDTGLYAVYFENLNGYNQILDASGIWFSSSNGDGWDNNIYIAAAQTGATLALPFSRDDTLTVRAGTILNVTGPGRASAYKVQGNVFDDEQVTTDGGLYQKGIDKRLSVLHTHSVDGATLDLVNADPTVEIYYLDSDTGSVTVNLPATTLTTTDDMYLTFKRLASGNATLLETFGTNVIDGVDDYTFAAQYDWITIHKPEHTDQWFIVAGV